MALKSLAEIAFDAFQVFADHGRRYSCSWKELNPEQKVVWERVAGRVEAETVLRDGEENNVPM